MIETIYIIRHGYRANWIDARCGSVTGLARDHPLAAYGEVQAQELATYFQALPEAKRPTAIFSSPYYRCLQTAAPIASALNIPIYVEHGISEWYSPVAPGTGLHPRPSPAADLKRYFTDIDPSWSSIWYPSRKGEDVEEVHARVNGCLELLVPEVEARFADKHKSILLVSHAATTIALCRGLLARPDMSLRVGCCSVSEFARKPATSSVLGAWHATMLADGSPLKDGTTRGWSFDDIKLADGKVVHDVGVPDTEGIENGPCGPQMQLRSLL